MRNILFLLSIANLGLPLYAAPFDKLLPLQSRDCAGYWMNGCDQEEQDAWQNQMLDDLHDFYKGETCILVANGPSLNKMDFSFMKNYNVIIGLNKIHLGFERFGFNVTHHVSVNRLVGEQNRDALLYEHDCRTLRFQTVREKHLLPCDQKKTNILTMVTQSSGAPRCGPFCGDIRLGVQESHTVTFVGLQIAFYMGCETVVLVGLDHNFQQEGPPDRARDMKGNDPNHFDPRYFKDMKWHTANLPKSETGYKVARAVYEKFGRRIIDATIDGKCDIFEKADYRQVLKFN